LLGLLDELDAPEAKSRPIIVNCDLANAIEPRLTQHLPAIVPIEIARIFLRRTFWVCEPATDPQQADRLGLGASTVRSDDQVHHGATPGKAETEAILRRFTKQNLQHPTYKAFAELGKAIKTIFLWQYLHSEALRREIQRRPERGRTMERHHGFRVLCPSWQDGQQPPGRPRDQHARAAPDSELHGLHQHVDDSETTGAAALAREADTPRLRCADPADLGTRESVWPIRSRHEYAIGVAVIEMAPGDTTVGSTPNSFSPGHRLVRADAKAVRPSR
jgi:hypothetical protein